MFLKVLSRLFLFFQIFILSACYRPYSQAYREFYYHLNQFYPTQKEIEETPYYLVILVDARHLDYTSNLSFFRTIAKYPNVGHAWIYLHGFVDGQEVVIEGGHSGERGNLQAKYFDGIMNYNEWGYANPTEAQKQHPRYEPNPVKYLWTVQEDGYFEEGSGHHIPTFAAKIDLTEQQFQHILAFIHPRFYPYHQYALTRHQCSSFVAQVAALADFFLNYEVSINIDPIIYYRGCWIRFWQDPQYAQITFASPDVIERSLMQAVREGRAECALEWYRSKG